MCVNIISYIFVINNIIISIIRLYIHFKFIYSIYFIYLSIYPCSPRGKTSTASGGGVWAGPWRWL